MSDAGINQLARRSASAAALAAAATLMAAMALAPAAVRAEEPTVAVFDNVFANWMQRHGVGRGVIAVARQGRLVHANGFNMAATAAVPVASLSKAVTAVRVAELVQQGKLAFSTPLSQALARTFQRLGGPADARLAGVTVAQLVTHRAGYRRDGQKDPLPSALSRHRSAAAPDIGVQVAALLRQPLQMAPGTQYGYSNAAYLLLGAVVEEAAGAPYEAHCRSTVLAKVGAPDARLVPRSRLRSSYGGWEFTAAQYLAFYEVFGPQGPILSATTRDWVQAAEGKQVTAGAHYGLGTYVRFAGGTHDFWQHGAWQFSFKGAYAHLNANLGTAVARLGEQGFSWFAFYEPQPAETAKVDLDRWMAATGGSIRKWP